MKHRFIVLLLTAATPLWAQQGPQDIHPYFSPNGGCTEAVVSALDRANKTVLVQAYSFTSAPIAKALVDAKKRDVDVRVILDKSQRTERYTAATFLANEGVPTYIDSNHAIAHNKLMVIDGDEVITGSFNFTKAAESSNAENLLVINNAPDLAARYTANWNEHLRHSEPYQGRSGGIATPPPSPTAVPAISTSIDATANYWLSKTGKRHNSSCKWFKTCAGKECGATDGVTCKMCGG